MFTWSSDGGSRMGGGFNDSGQYTGDGPSTGTSPKGVMLGDPYSALIGGLIQYQAQMETNRTNKQIAHDATLANMSEAEKNRFFQQMMSNSAYQRQMEDMKRAGLNPLLAAGMSGASTPSGSQGKAETAHMENPISGALSTAIQIKQLGQSIQKTDAEIGQMGAQKKLMEQQGALADAQRKKTGVESLAIAKDIPKSDLFNSVYNGAKQLFNDANSAVAKPNSAVEKRVLEMNEMYNPKPKQIRLNPGR